MAPPTEYAQGIKSFQTIFSDLWWQCSIYTLSSTITLRERDGMKQIRVTQDEVFEIVSGILEGDSTFDDALAKFGEFQGQELDE